MKQLAAATLLIALLAVPATLLAQDTTATTLQGSIHWDETQARREALKNIERQIDLQFFKSKDENFLENVRLREQNPNLRFANRQVTFFTGGEYAVVYEGEPIVNYYTAQGDLFKVSVCSEPFGDDTWNYPRRCIEYRYPDGSFLTVSLDVSPEESYVFAPDGTLLYHWKDEQGFDINGNSVWERWNYDVQN